MAETYYAWNPVFDCITKETDAAGATVAEYTQEPKLFGGLISQHRGSTSNYYHYDRIGTTRALTAANQTTSDTAVYSAFGEKTASTGTTVNSFGYVGSLGYFANSHSVSVRRRDYRAMLGRWLSSDPVFRQKEKTQYCYARNEPLTRNDPSGLASLACVRDYRSDGSWSVTDVSAESTTDFSGLVDGVQRRNLSLVVELKCAFTRNVISCYTCSPALLKCPAPARCCELCPQLGTVVTAVSNSQIIFVETVDQGSIGIPGWPKGVPGGSIDLWKIKNGSVPKTRPAL